MPKNANVIATLNEALATEIVCVLRYRNHAYLVTGRDSLPVRDEFLKHSDDELKHMDQLAQRITELGGKPDFNPSTISSRSSVDYIEGKGLASMIRANLAAEKIAIETYTEAIQSIGDSDPTTRRLLEEILAKEEEHEQDLDNLL